VTNQLGWRGAPIEDPRLPRTVRIVFVGSSVAMDAPHLPFGFTERAGYWLNLWAASRKLDLRFEVLNAGRESIGSSEIAAVVTTEVLPLRPDLVVYHEGGNQFRLDLMVEKMPAGEAAHPPRPQASIPDWLQTAARYSALATRISTALRIAGIEAANAAASGTGTANSGAEWPKPDYRIVWPAGLDEADPDLAYPKLPVSLSIIQRDLDRIRNDLDGIDAQFALTSFIWLAKDGLVLDPVRHRYIIDQLNISNYPFRYRDIERLAAFQNRLLAKYARAYGMPFIDFARDMPLEPDLFIDAVHTNKAGSRLKGWVAFNQLVPIIEEHLAAGDWPKAPPAPPPALPTLTPATGQRELSLVAPGTGKRVARLRREFLGQGEAALPKLPFKHRNGSGRVAFLAIFHCHVRFDVEAPPARILDVATIERRKLFAVRLVAVRGSEQHDGNRQNENHKEQYESLHDTLLRSNVVQSLTLTASAINCASLLESGAADSRQNAAPRIQFTCPLVIGPLRTKAMHCRCGF
jgi:hypothetical protein